MRVLLSTYDSRGGVEPLLGLALRLRELGAEVRMCAPPDCAERLAEVGVPLLPFGPPVRTLVHGAAPPTPADVPRRVAEVTAAAFDKVGAAARDDCFAVGEVNQQALFGRVAAVVHHGGAGTTTTATRSGAPQVVVPQWGDQPYFASRVADLGIGAAHEVKPPTVESLSAALSAALAPATRARAAAVAGTIRTDGAAVAATRLLDTVGRDRKRMP